jgi:hypothetical protein
MKRTLILLSVCLFTLNLFSQLTPELKLRYEDKVKHYENMQKAGVVLFLTGPVPTVIGIILIKNGMNNPDFGLFLKEFITGDIVTIIGAAMIAGGLVFKINGKRKAAEYQKKLELSIGDNSTFKGISITYWF